MPKGTARSVPNRKFWKQICLSQAVAIGLSPFLPLTAMAQPVVAPTPVPTPTPGTTSVTPSFTVPDTRSNIILPTDILPLSTAQDRVPFGENFQLRLNQILPARFYFSASVETSLRLETNPFQFPTKRALLRQLPPPQQFQQLSASQQASIRQIVRQASSEDLVFRVLPNVSGGFTLTPRTRLFANYFLIRDQLAKNIRLNTIIHSYAWGLQQDFPIGERGNLQAEMQFRELNQTHQQSVFDFLPGLTFSYIVNPKTVAFANALVQMRGKKYFQAPTKEIDPFYTGGILHSRGGWTFAASTTFVQNFREPFRGNATLPFNNYAIISDFEIARRLFKQIPGFQGFIRAEPIWNFHSHNRPGLAGMDFRLFFGFRGAVAKPALTATINNIIEQLRQQENDPAPGGKNAPKPSAYYPPQIMADVNQHQPIHGVMDGPATQIASTQSTASVMPDVEQVNPEIDDGTKTASVPAVVGTPDIASADWSGAIAQLPQPVAIDERVIRERWTELDSNAAQSTSIAFDTTEKRIASYISPPGSADRRSAPTIAKAPGSAGLTAARASRSDAEGGPQACQPAPAATPPVIATKPVTVEPKIDIGTADWTPLISSIPQGAYLQNSSALLGSLEQAAAQSSTIAAQDTAKRLSSLVAKAPEAKPLTQPHAVALTPPPAPAFSADPTRVAQLLQNITTLAQSLEAPKFVDTNRLLQLADAGASQSTIASSMHTFERTSHLVAHKLPEPKPESIDIAKADWSAAARNASGVDAALRYEEISNLIASAESASTTYGAAETNERIASVVHIAPITAPAAPMPIAVKVGAPQPAPKPMAPTLASALENSITPLPKQILITPSKAQPEPLAVALMPSAPKLELGPSARPHITDAPSLKAIAAPHISEQPAPQPIGHKSNTGPQPPKPALEPAIASIQPQVKSMTSSTASKAPELKNIAQHQVSAEEPKPIAVSVPPMTLPTQPEPVMAIDVASAPNWEALAQLSVGRAVLSWQYLGGLRQVIDSAANESARALDYTVLQKMRKTAIASRPPRQVAQEAQKQVPAQSATIFVPMKKIAAPDPLGVERTTSAQSAPSSLAVERAEAKEGPPTAPKGWNHSSSTHKSRMQIHVVPPLPTVHVNDRANPFRDTGIDIKKLMLSVPR